MINRPSGHIDTIMDTLKSAAKLLHALYNPRLTRNCSCGQNKRFGKVWTARQVEERSTRARPGSDPQRQ
jgi:hypothetical protein